jgi:5-bromo-4-chloroindolyl phosphate hydrolysis protein
MKEDVFSLQEGDVTFQWPESLSKDSYQDLEDWTKLMLRKIKRSIESSATKSDEDDVLS